MMGDKNFLWFEDLDRIFWDVLEKGTTREFGERGRDWNTVV